MILNNMTNETRARLTDTVNNRDMAICVATIRADIADMLAYITILENRLASEEKGAGETE